MPQAVAAVTDDGVAWAVPLSQKCVALYVNTALAPSSWQSMDTLDDIAKWRSVVPDGSFVLAWENGAYAQAGLFAAYGAHLLGPNDEFGLVGPGADAAARYARALVDDGVVPEDADGALVTSLFKSGRAAFAISGPWLAAEIGPSSDALRYYVTELPVVGRPGAGRMRPLMTFESVMLSPRGAARADVRALARRLARSRRRGDAGEIAHALTARARPAARRRPVLVRAFAARGRVRDPDALARRDARYVGACEPRDPQGAPTRRRARGRVRRGEASVRRRAPPAAAARVARAGAVRRRRARPRSPRSRSCGARSAAIFARSEVKRSMPAYAYVAHAVVVVGALVAVPLAIGAATSLFAGHDETRRYVGLANFVSILTARGGPLLASGSFYLVLLVTILWTVVNVALHLAIGVTLALVLARPTLRLRGAYRVLLVVPWAVPSYVTALAWKGMFHRQFGAVTALILALDRALGLHVEPIAWFSRFSTAFTANVATNVWLGFPFMMVVTLGALTSVPDDVLEAAKVDGATRAQRFWLVTLPIIRPTLAPAALLGAIWTFNMFNVVFLVSGGDPDGTTDILVSEAYRWAFTREAQYGYAAAYAVLIFVLLLAHRRASPRACRAQRARGRAA